MLNIRYSRPDEIGRTYEIWRSSVDATHHFLSPGHLAEIDELIRNHYLPSTELLVAVDEQDLAHGFMGLSDKKIESLFVHGDSRGRGVGRALVAKVFGRHAEVLVDVNEQNASARGFYEHMGFKPYGRSETDDQGRPYPVLHLRGVRNLASAGTYLPTTPNLPTFK